MKISFSHKYMIALTVALVALSYIFYFREGIWTGFAAPPGVTESGFVTANRSRSATNTQTIQQKYSGQLTSTLHGYSNATQCMMDCKGNQDCLDKC